MIRTACVPGALAALASVLTAVPAPAQTAAPAADPRAGRGFIATPVHSLEEDRALLALFEGLRVADVTDGMDAMGLQNVGLMDPEVRPLWKDTQDYAHRFVGRGSDCHVALPFDTRPDVCKRCRSCIEVCPTESISMVDEHAFIDVESCIECGSCEAECPEGAISEGDGIYVIDANKCQDCGACADVCPTGACLKL